MDQPGLVQKSLVVVEEILMNVHAMAKLTVDDEISKGIVTLIILNLVNAPMEKFGLLQNKVVYKDF